MSKEFLISYCAISISIIHIHNATEGPSLQRSASNSYLSGHSTLRVYSAAHINVRRNYLRESLLLLLLDMPLFYSECHRLDRYPSIQVSPRIALHSRIRSMLIKLPITALFLGQRCGCITFVLLSICFIHLGMCIFWIKNKPQNLEFAPKSTIYFSGWWCRALLIVILLR